MIKIGFIDKYMNNWHSDHYPEYLRAAAKLYGIDAQLYAAWAETDHPDGGMTTGQWCSWQGVKRASSCEELIDAVDVIMVMCADNCLPHEELAHMALACGKPVYCDKTFAPDLASARRMFDRAEKYGTPMFTCSAQRYCMELLGYLDLRKAPTVYCATTGPGDMVNYSIHQFEMLQHIMGYGASRCKGYTVAGSRHLIYEYKDGRMATFTQSTNMPFTLNVSEKEGHGRNIEVCDYYMNFLYTLLEFFVTHKPPVSRKDTMEIMAMQQAGREALASPDMWVEVSQLR